MRARTKYTLAGCATAAGVGLWLGYTRIAFFIPGATVQRLRTLKLGGKS